MIKELIMYTVVCDNCGADANEDAEYSCWSDRGYAEESATESDWEKDGDKHYCPECFSWDDDDNLVIDAKRTKLKDERKKQ
jgi:hypothetical protein